MQKRMPHPDRAAEPGRPSPRVGDRAPVIEGYAQRLGGFKARWPDETSGVVEGVSLVVRVPHGQLRVVPVEAVDRIAEPQREVALRPAVEPHGFPRHRSLRRLDGRWRVELGVEAPVLEAGYWLARCERFLVGAPGAEVGVVEAVLFADSGVPQTLLVRANGPGAQLVEVSADEVVEIVPERRTLALESDLERPEAEPGRISAWTAFARRWEETP
jgi:hypothetical protein